MSRRAFVVIGKWPFSQLTTVGQLTSCCSGSTENHIGVFIPCCTPDEIAAHSKVGVSEPSARGAQHVTFDFMIDKFPRFQSSTNPRYWTEEAEIYCYPILDVDAAEIHKACLEAAQIRPYNNDCYRVNGLCGGCWPCHCWPSNTPLMAPSTCVALTLRIIARARAQSVDPFTSDAETLRVLGIPRWSCTNPCGAGALVGMRPRGGLEYMQAASVIGSALQGFERAIAMCRRGSGGGSGLPNLSLKRI